MLAILPLLYSIIVFAITLYYLGVEGFLKCSRYGYCSKCSWRSICKALGLYERQSSLRGLSTPAISRREYIVCMSLIIIGYIASIITPLTTPTTYIVYKTAYISSIIVSLPWMILSFKNISSQHTYRH